MGARVFGGGGGGIGCRNVIGHCAGPLVSVQVYADCNAAIRSAQADPARLQIFLPLISHISNALGKLNPQPQVVYRGINISVSALDYTRGSMCAWPAFSSTSADPKVSPSSVAPARDMLQEPEVMCRGLSWGRPGRGTGGGHGRDAPQERGRGIPHPPPLRVTHYRTPTTHPPLVMTAFSNRPQPLLKPRVWLPPPPAHPGGAGG